MESSELYRGKSLPLVAEPGDYVNRPIDEAIAMLERDLSQGSKELSFDIAFDICDSARSVFGAYVLEWTLNGAESYRQRVELLIRQAQPLLEKALQQARSAGSTNVRYLQEYVAHNTDRTKVLGILHTRGRVAAEEELLSCVRQ